MCKNLIFTMRVNEYVTRAPNRHAPFTPDEVADTAAACREVGREPATIDVARDTLGILQATQASQ